MRQHDEQLLVEVVQQLCTGKYGDSIEVTNINQCFGGVINAVYFLDCLIQEDQEILETSLVLKIYCGKTRDERLNQIVKDFYVYNLLSQHLDTQSANNNNSLANNYVWNIAEGYDNILWYFQNRVAIVKSLFPFALLWNLASSQNNGEDVVDVASFLSQYTFVIMTKVEGSPLNVIRRSEPSFKSAVYQQIGELIAKLHQIKISGSFGMIEGSTIPVAFGTNEAFMCDELKKALEAYKLHRGDLFVAEKIESYFETHKAILKNCTDPCFCHNDIHEGNILITSNQISGLIDVSTYYLPVNVKVEAAVSGDPLLDLAKIFIFSTKRDHVKDIAFLEGYTIDKKLPQDAAQRIFLYELLVVLQMWNFHASSGEVRPQTLSSVDKFIREVLHEGTQVLEHLLEQFIS